MANQMHAFQIQTSSAELYPPNFIEIAKQWLPMDFNKTFCISFVFENPPLSLTSFSTG